MRIPESKLVTIAEETREQLLKDDLTIPNLRETFLTIEENKFENCKRRKKVSIPKISLISADNDQNSSSHGKSSGMTSQNFSSSRRSSNSKRKGFLSPNDNRRRTIILVEEVDSTVKNSSRADTCSMMNTSRQDFQEHVEAL